MSEQNGQGEVHAIADEGEDITIARPLEDIPLNVPRPDPDPKP